MSKKIKSFFKDTLLISLITFILLEIALRGILWVVKEPLKSYLEEINTLKYPTERLYYPFSAHFSKGAIVSKILLPKQPTSADTPTDLLVVGDSFVFSDRCTTDSSLTVLLAQQTRKKIVNVGVRGTSLPTYNRMLEVGMRYKPKKVLYCLFANDWQYEQGTKVEKLSVDNVHKNLPTDYFVTEDSLNWDYTVSYWRKRVTSYFMLPYLVQLLRFRGIGAANQSLLKNYTFDITTNQQHLYYSFGGTAYFEKILSYNEPSVREALQLNLAFVEEAKRFAVLHQAEFEVVLFPPKEFVYVQLLPPAEQAKICSEDIKKTYEVFADSLSKRNIPCYDMTKDLQQLANQGKKLYFTIDGHFNHTGNAEVAKIWAAKGW